LVKKNTFGKSKIVLFFVETNQKLGAIIRIRVHHNILNLSKYYGKHKIPFRRIKSGSYPTRV